jgi:6-phosphofructo-2-kinase / fructose-2,6-biphosphatase 2
MSQLRLACGNNYANFLFLSLPFCSVMVGLPARGKTYIARKLSRYLSWLGLRTQVFNVGNYRRKQFGAAQPHNFFDSSNREARQQRTRAAMDALEDMKKWFNESETSERKY